jgi:beta-1,4-mannosyl-glycoprotein beta-1,4-N-acetylglucosaminyltransferase
MLVDTFQFYNELDILELRLRELDPYVDIFVISESPETHAGRPKPLFFQENKERYAQWLPKIRHVICPPCTSSGIWDREKWQRHCILDGLEGIPDDAIVMVSDADEIPDLRKFSPMDPCVPTSVVHMFMFEYSFDYMFTGEPWFGTVITKADAFRKLGPNFFRDNRWRFRALPYSGWHCSSFGDSKHVWNKIQNYAHALDEKHSHQSFEDFDRYLREGLHSDGAMKLVPRPPEVPLPTSASTYTGWSVSKQ